MPERTHIPTSPACGLWETLLAGRRIHLLHSPGDLRGLHGPV